MDRVCSKPTARLLPSLSKRLRPMRILCLKSEELSFFPLLCRRCCVWAAAAFCLRAKKGGSYNIADPRSDIRLKDLAAILAENAGKRLFSSFPTNRKERDIPRPQRRFSTRRKSMLSDLRRDFPLPRVLKEPLKFCGRKTDDKRYCAGL